MHISEINIYPIKSLKGISMNEATVEARGLRHDRRWMLTNADGMFLTQREFPRMALIGVEVTSDELRVTSDGFGCLSIPFEPDRGERRPVTIWQSICDGEAYRGEVSEWFSDVLETDCQLVHMPEQTKRSVNSRFDRGGEIVSFADGYPLLVMCEASLAELNSRLDEPLPMNRFRPNLVVSGSDAFAEDGWERITSGETSLRVTKPCARCVITTIDQAAGRFDGKEPLATLAKYRMARDVMPERCEALGLNATDVLFGQNLIPETFGTQIRVGDEVDATV